MVAYHAGMPGATSMLPALVDCGSDAIANSADTPTPHTAQCALLIVQMHPSHTAECAQRAEVAKLRLGVSHMHKCHTQVEDK